MKKTLLFLGLTSLLVSSVQAANMPEKEAGLLLGGTYLDKDAVGSDDRFNPTFGARYAQRLGTNTNFFTDFTYTPFSRSLFNGETYDNWDGDLYTLRGGVEWLFSQQAKYNWFLSGGLGAMRLDLDNGGPDFTRPLLSVGVGQSWEAGSNDTFRWEVRADQSWGNGDLPGSSLTNIQALVGYSWGFGSPADTDGDGVADRNDQCPNTPKGAKVDVKGCPLDSDGDGVYDGLDQCPGTPAGVKVDGKGCPLDTDGDGISDDKDKCPTVYAKTEDGCPPPPPPIVQAPTPEPAPAAVEIPKKLVLEGVNFDNDKATLRPEAYSILDKAAETLKQWGDVKVEVAGHTDSVASEGYNAVLSEKRAQTVCDYLIKMGVEASRLIPKGLGESQPVADNDTEEGRFKNRRVELIPQQ